MKLRIGGHEPKRLVRYASAGERDDPPAPPPAVYDTTSPEFAASPEDRTLQRVNDLQEAVNQRLDLWQKADSDLARIRVEIGEARKALDVELFTNLVRREVDLVKRAFELELDLARTKVAFYQARASLLNDRAPAERAELAEARRVFEAAKVVFDAAERAATGRRRECVDAQQGYHRAIADLRRLDERRMQAARQEIEAVQVLHRVRGTTTGVGDV